MDLTALRDRLLSQARLNGWAAAGVAGVQPQRLARERGLRAIAEGRMAGMPWYTPDRVRASTDLRSRHPWAASLLALAWPYRPAVLPGPPRSGEPSPGGPLQADARPGRPRGRFSAYACMPGVASGTVADYHTVLLAQCIALADWLRGEVAGVRVKAFVDHGWAMDRAVAERAGIGFAGKNACVITTTAGSYVMLAEMLLSLPLPPTPASSRGCGRCRACLPACPTGAIVAPGVIDAPRCISYLTIEHRGAIAPELRPLMGTWAFGCDLCQEVCPINARLAPAAMAPGTASIDGGPVPFPDLVACLELDEDAFRARFRHTAVWRTGRAGLARNAAIALGNAGDAAALPALRRARDRDADEVVREAASWAIDRLARAGQLRSARLPGEPRRARAPGSR